MWQVFVSFAMKNHCQNKNIENILLLHNNGGKSNFKSWNYDILSVYRIKTERAQKLFAEL